MCLILKGLSIKRFQYYLIFIISFFLNAQNSTLDFYYTHSSLFFFEAIENGEVSGITWNPNTEKFLLINDENGLIWEADTNLSVIRIITGANFGDTEDIIYFNYDSYGIITEAGKLYIGDITDGNNNYHINVSDFQEISFTNHNGNSGPEGIAYDGLTEMIYIAKEKNPMEIYRFQLPTSHNDITIDPEIPFDAQSIFANTLDDISAILFDERIQRLLVLSEDSNKIIDVEPENGTIKGFYDLENDHQYEGISFLDKNYNLVIVGEPNFYLKVFRNYQSEIINLSFNLICVLDSILTNDEHCFLDLNYGQTTDIFDTLIAIDLQNGFNYYNCSD